MLRETQTTDLHFVDADTLLMKRVATGMCLQGVIHSEEMENLNHLQRR